MVAQVNRHLARDWSELRCGETHGLLRGEKHDLEQERKRLIDMYNERGAKRLRSDGGEYGGDGDAEGSSAGGGGGAGSPRPGSKVQREEKEKREYINSLKTPQEEGRLLSRSEGEERHKHEGIDSPHHMCLW